MFRFILVFLFVIILSWMWYMLYKILEKEIKAFWIKKLLTISIIFLIPITYILFTSELNFVKESSNIESNVLSNTWITENTHSWKEIKVETKQFVIKDKEKFDETDYLKYLNSLKTKCNMFYDDSMSINDICFLGNYVEYLSDEIEFDEYSLQKSIAYDATTQDCLYKYARWDYISVTRRSVESLKDSLKEQNKETCEYEKEIMNFETAKKIK